jgi:hypothetical protein
MPMPMPEALEGEALEGEALEGEALEGEALEGEALRLARICNPCRRKPNYFVITWFA